MGIPGFFKQNKPRGFNYVPRHYDPVKEERDARRRAMGLGAQDESGERKAESGESDPTHSTYRRIVTRGSMRGSMRGYSGNRKERTQNNSVIRLIVIILILVLVTYLYLRF